MTARLLVIDNYDSFTFNLVQMFRNYPLEIEVFRTDKITVDELDAHAPDYILISPGPKNPSAAGISKTLIEQRFRQIPMLGVCLGMQCMNEAFGGKTIHAPLPMHGKTSRITHSNTGVFVGVPSPLKVARYHSLVVSDVQPDLVVTAKTDDDVIMGLAHKTEPLFGVQFHPESFLTEHGFTIVENFLSKGPMGGKRS